MIEKKTIVDQIEVTRTGHVQIRFAVQLVEDGVVIDQKWHRTSVAPGGNVNAQIAAVNAHLAQMGKASVDDRAGLQRIKNIVGVVHAPELIASSREELA